ncbi:MAG: DUF554 domain-containing protein [Oscillospiraceae bacterium]|nr:DUF554 domain-containing protein [Oscillospiraceae bacterium]
MAGVIVNTLAVLLGGSIGLVFKKGIPLRLTDAVMAGIGLCTVYLGVSGFPGASSALVIILSMVPGAIIGTLIGIDSGLERFGKWAERKSSGKGENPTGLAQGFVTASLLFCIGAMTITGSLQSGLTGDNRILFAKSVLDFISSIVLTASLGVGVILAAAFVLVFQGAIVLAAGLLAPLLTGSVIADMSCVGSILILALGLNILKITELKVANYLPAIFLPPAITPFIAWLTGLTG